MGCRDDLQHEFGKTSIAKALVRRQMEQRPFGLTQRQVPVVGQGTWYLDHGLVPSPSPRCAPAWTSA